MPSRFRTTHAALCLALALLAGCGQSVCLVSDVPPPPLRSHQQKVLAAPADTALRHDTAPWGPTAAERSWRFIIVHHSGTDSGDAATFDQAHRNRGWDELGYHFVIGNGTGSRDGQLEVGSRWRKQKHGAHTKVRGHEEYNELGIGICLVGNFNESQPSEAQMRSLPTLIRGLMQRYNVPKSRVLGHGMLAPTDCPGKQFEFRDLYRRL